MKAVVAKRPGGPEVLEIADIAEPTPQEGEVKIRVHAFGLNKDESYFRRGDFGDVTPFVPGVEAAGESCAPVIESLHLMEDLPSTVKMGFFSVGTIRRPAALIDDCPLNELAERVHNSELASTVVKVFSFDEIQAAHRQLDEGSSTGKIVVTI